MLSLLSFCTGLPLRASRTPLFASETSLLFATPISFQTLDSFTPAGLDTLTSSILASWEQHVAEQAALPLTGDRSTGDHEKVFRATTDQRLNDEFFYFQMREFGIDGHQSSPRGWLATAEAQALLGEVADHAARYLKTIARHAGVRAPSVSFHPDMLQAWANVHWGSGKQPRHVHAGAVASCVFYTAAPPGAASISFFDPRCSLPPLAGHAGMRFERELRHSPQAGDLLIFPPWLPHAVGSGDGPGDERSHESGSSDDGPRVSIAFNLIAGGDLVRAWGEPTAALGALNNLVLSASSSTRPRMRSPSEPSPPRTSVRNSVRNSPSTKTIAWRPA